MIKNFKNELNSINSNKNISEKLMAFSLYNEFYNYMLQSIGDYLMEYYAPVIEKTFELVVAGLNLQENVRVNAKQFMKAYFQMLKTNGLGLSSMWIVKKTITIFENELNALIDASGYVNIIDQFELISLDEKVNIMAHFREYINNMFFATSQIYGEEGSKELRHNIFNMLSVKLENYLKDSLEQGVEPNNLSDNLQPTMIVSTKNYLINKLISGEFGFESIQDEDTRKFFTSSSEIEQKVWLMAAIYAIAGYDKNDKSKDKEKMEEICRLLGISRFKYIKVAISIAIHFSKELIKMYGEKFDGGSQKKRK